MRRLGALFLVFALLPLATAGDPYVVLVDWQSGRALVGTTVLAMSPVADVFPFDVDTCHRTILVDLLYDPQEVGIDATGVGEVFLSYEFLVELWSNGTRVGAGRVREPAYGISMATTEAAGPHEIRLSLANGADVTWQLRVRASSIPGDLACEPRIVINEVELNPPGPDASNEWVELFNAGDEGADLSLWRMTATHGAPVDLMLPEGTWLDAGARVVVPFTSGQALDNADEVIELVDAFMRPRDQTPALTDAQNDAHTWQRTGDGGVEWQFVIGTQGASNVP
jgi:hypothetical protein